MSAPNPTCSNCDGTGKIPSVMLDLHGDNFHDCFCVTHDQGPKHPEDMTREEVNAEILEWRTGQLYRGYDRIQALKVPGLKAERDVAWKTGALAGALAAISALEEDPKRLETFPALEEEFAAEIVLGLTPPEAQGKP